MHINYITGLQFTTSNLSSTTLHSMYNFFPLIFDTYSHDTLLIVKLIKIILFFKRGLIPTHYNYSCVLSFTTL